MLLRRRSDVTSQRGAVLVESAFAVTFIMALVYGSIQLGMVGLEQLTVDGGAFTAAHQQALLGANPHGYQDAPTLAKATLPHLNSPNVSVPEPAIGEPPTTEAAGNYFLNKPNARHGGVSMIQPTQTIATVTSTNFASLLLDASQKISVTGIAIDPAFRLINGHGDVSGSAFNSAAAFATATDPLVDGDNAPPYFIGFNYMSMCPQAYAGTTWGSSCPVSAQFVGLGLAEYLDSKNWGRPINGVVPDGQAVFYEARLHQNKFADIAGALVSAGGNTTTLASVLNPNQAGPVKCVYSFDNTQLGAYAVGTTHIGDFPLNPGGDPAAC